MSALCREPTAGRAVTLPTVCLRYAHALMNLVLHDQREPKRNAARVSSRQCCSDPHGLRRLVGLVVLGRAFDFASISRRIIAARANKSCVADLLGGREMLAGYVQRSDQSVALIVKRRANAAGRPPHPGMYEMMLCARRYHVAP